MSHSSPSEARRRIVPSQLVQLLLSRRLGTRYATLLGLGIVTFLLCQTIAYWWLPEGLLRGRSIGALATGEEAAHSFGAEWARIVAFNLLILLIFYVAANLIRLSNGLPLGYNTVIVMQAYFGVITGTNSFSLIVEAGKIAPSLYWLVTPGFYELAAYALAAAATYEISRWQDMRIQGKTKAVRFHPSEGGWRNPQVWIGLGVAIAVLVATNAWEASLVMGA